jgi:hypothetical protein
MVESGETTGTVVEEVHERSILLRRFEALVRDYHYYVGRYEQVNLACALVAEAMPSPVCRALQQLRECAADVAASVEAAEARAQVCQLTPTDEVETSFSHDCERVLVSMASFAAVADAIWPTICANADGISHSSLDPLRAWGKGRAGIPSEQGPTLGVVWAEFVTRFSPGLRVLQQDVALLAEKARYWLQHLLDTPWVEPASSAHARFVTSDELLEHVAAFHIGDPCTPDDGLGQERHGVRVVTSLDKLFNTILTSWSELDSFGGMPATVRQAMRLFKADAGDVESRGLALKNALPAREGDPVDTGQLIDARERLVDALLRLHASAPAVWPTICSAVEAICMPTDNDALTTRQRAEAWRVFIDLMSPHFETLTLTNFVKGHVEYLLTKVFHTSESLATDDSTGFSPLVRPTELVGLLRQLHRVTGASPESSDHESLEDDFEDAADEVMDTDDTGEARKRYRVDDGEDAAGADANSGETLRPPKRRRDGEGVG